MKKRILPSKKQSDNQIKVTAGQSDGSVEVLKHPTEVNLMWYELNADLYLVLVRQTDGRHGVAI